MFNVYNKYIFVTLKIYFFSYVVEYDMALPSDSYRKEQLVGAMATEGHPMSKFMWGMCEPAFMFLYTPTHIYFKGNAV